LLEEAAMVLEIKLADVAIVIATMIGPVLAVQAQKWIERGRGKKARQRGVFARLMATRAALLSPAAVEAFNAVPIEFYGEKPIIDAWKAYFNHMNAEGTPPDMMPVWIAKRIDLLGELLHRMAGFLGYDFNMVEITKEIYSPKAHGQIETDQEIIRRGVARLIAGEIALPISVTAMPTDPQVRELLANWFKGETTLPVKVTA
jgi:hypothetical protein